MELYHWRCSYLFKESYLLFLAEWEKHIFHLSFFFLFFVFFVIEIQHLHFIKSDCKLGIVIIIQESLYLRKQTS